LLQEKDVPDSNYTRPNVGKGFESAWAIYLNIDQKFLFDEKKGFEI